MAQLASTAENKPVVHCYRWVILRANIILLGRKMNQTIFVAFQVRSCQTIFFCIEIFGRMGRKL